MATATYPPPPPYYRLYKDYLEDPKSAPEPPPPIEGTYVCFGATYTTSDVLPSLEEQGVRQLYPKGANVGYLTDCFMDHEGLYCFGLCLIAFADSIPSNVEL
ncbi:Mediator of RNA polymerase II transcription subunit 7a [Stylosanthes scabra]|uniref:Mediator of RNA polymerase II transcription subunit 7 n=1 Tax=Stylosanthes scabra TaxID=79078 RepID=A0ABU6RIP4_9FABA|nr:Mediator of RNA polymerase II transcription subunit 7a [Stylosanthes scabra]